MVTAERTQKSTIVRTSKSWRMRLVRLGFGTLERVAPGLGGHRAALLWCTPPAGRGRRRDDRPSLPSERRTLTTPHGARIAAEAWGAPDAAPVYLVHGWGGWRGQLGPYVAPLVAAGRRVIAYDAPSHGESGPGILGPRRATATEFADALGTAVAAYGPPAGIVAHSLGCATTMLALGDGLPAARLALVAPVTDPLDRIAEFTLALGAGDRTRAALLGELERYGGRPVADFAVAGLPARLPFPPCLVVHDRDDKEAPYDEGRELAEGWPSGGLITTAGLGHQRILRDADVVAAVCTFVTR